jgi:hypothetical protein
MRALYKYGFVLREIAEMYGVVISTVHRRVNAKSREHSKLYQRTYAYTRRRAVPANKMWSGAKERARLEGLPFTITKEDVVVPEVCPVLGITLVVGTGAIHDASPTLDRRIPGLGYVSGNVAVISFLANRIKTNATAEQIRRVADWADG